MTSERHKFYAGIAFYQFHVYTISPQCMTEIKPKLWSQVIAVVSQDIMIFQHFCSGY